MIDAHPKPSPSTMSHNVPVGLDPVNSAVSKEFETQHIVRDDDGEHLMAALAEACAAAAEMPITFVDAAASGSDGGASTSATSASSNCTKLSLADVPYQFLRVEVDEHGHLKQPGHDSSTTSANFADLGERRGLLSEYFTNRRGTQGYWYHRHHPASYQDDFPHSANNFDCERLVEDLEEVNDLLDRDATRWVLWAGVPQSQTAPLSGKNGAQSKSLAVNNGTPVFSSRRRILSVKDLIDVLNEIRRGLNPSPEDVGKGKETARAISPVCFIVAVSYKCRFRTSDVPPAPPMTTGGMMMPPVLATTLTFFTNAIKQSSLQAQSDESSSSYAGSDDDDDYDDDDYSCVSGSDHDREYDSEPDGLNIDYFADSHYGDNGDGGYYSNTLVRYDANNRPYYVRYDDPEEYNKALKEKEIEFAQKCLIPANPFWPFGSSDLFSRGDADNSGSGQDTPESSSASSSSPRLEPETEATSVEEEAPTQRPTTPPSPPKPVSILETLDTNAAKGDAVEGDLHALLPEAHSPTAEQWRECCELLCIDPEANKDAQVRSIKVPGTDNMLVKPSQLWTAYWMLSSRLDRGLCGGILADVMGTGKTYVCLVVCLLRAYIAYNRAEVEREWQLREHEAGKKGGNVAPKQHLPRNTSGSTNTPCTCGNSMGIECYANPGGITRRLADGMSRGASLILAPQTVLDNWVKTVKHVRLQAKYYEPVVFNAKMTKEDIVLAPAPRLKQKLQMEVRPQPHISGDGLFPQTWEPNVHDVVHEYKPSIAKDAYPERFILLATHMPEKLTEFFQLPVPLRRKAGAGARERKTVYGCPVGIQLVDEFHKAKDDVIALAQQHKHLQSDAKGADNFDFWAITGTPLPAKLTDLENITDIVQRLPEWDVPTSRHHGSRVVELRDLQVAYDKAVAEDGTPEQAGEFRARAERFFHGGLVKRHTEASTFFGQRIFNLQDVAAKVVVHTTPEPLREDVSKVVARVATKIRESMADSQSAAAPENNWEQAVRSSSLFNHMMDLEILATFPGAARLMLANPPAVDFGLAAIRGEIRKAEDRDVTKVALFQKHLDTVIEGSPHLQTILATLDEMERDKQKRRALPTPVAADTNTRSVLPKKKIDLGLKKLVVLCPRMGEAVFVYLALRKLRPDVNPIFLHADLKLSERTALLQDFNKLDAPTPAGIVHSARVLVGTFRDAGTGNDLTVASYQILTGPLRLRSQQDQAFGRTNREGQSLPLRHKLLVTEDSPVDRIVIVTQARRHIVSDPFNMDEKLELAAVEEEVAAVSE